MEGVNSTKVGLHKSRSHFYMPCGAKLALQAVATEGAAKRTRWGVAVMLELRYRDPGSGVANVIAQAVHVPRGQSLEVSSA